MHFCSGFLFEKRWQVLRLGHTFWYNEQLMEVFESYANFYWTYEKKSGNLLLPWYFQVDCWKVPNNEIDEHVTILECLGGKPLESSVFHGDLTSQKKTLRFVESEIVFATWLGHFRCRCVSKCSRVSWFLFGTNVWTQKIHLCFVIEWFFDW